MHSSYMAFRPERAVTVPMQNPEHPAASNPEGDASVPDDTNLLLETVGTVAFVTGDRDGEFMEFDTSLLRDATAWR